MVNLLKFFLLLGAFFASCNVAGLSVYSHQPLPVYKNTETGAYDPCPLYCFDPYSDADRRLAEPVFFERCLRQWKANFCRVDYYYTHATPGAAPSSSTPAGSTVSPCPPCPACSTCPEPTAGTGPVTIGPGTSASSPAASPSDGASGHHGRPCHCVCTWPISMQILTAISVGLNVMFLSYLGTVCQQGNSTGPIAACLRRCIGVCKYDSTQKKDAIYENISMEDNVNVQIEITEQSTFRKTDAQDPLTEAQHRQPADTECKDSDGDSTIVAGNPVIA